MRRSVFSKVAQGTLVALWSVAALVAGWSQPQETVLRLPNDTVRITRDRYGVPTVQATTFYGLLYGNGYAIAQDRLWQMELYRRQARGELAEIMGARALEQDRATRIEGYTEAELQAQIARLPTELQEALSAYAAGVSAWMEEAKRAGKLPKQFAEHGIEPRPWQPTDSVAIGVMMLRRFGGILSAGDLRNYALYQFLKARNKDLAPVWANDLLWLQDPTSPTTVPAEDDPRQAHRRDPRETLQRMRRHLELLPEIGLNVLLPALRIASGEAQIEFARAHGLYTQFGSYAILVSPQRSATGIPMLVGAPQMGFSVPHIATEIHLMGAGINARGMTFAGVPGVLIGTTEHLAWTFTSGVSDLCDAFILKLNPQNPEQYWYKGTWRTMDKRTETIRVKGAEPVQLTVYRCVYGPVVAIDTRNHVAVAIKLSYWDGELEALRAYYGILRARTVGDFERAVAHIPASFNAFCLTRTGDIAYFYCGRVPIRPEGVDPRLPLLGTGEYDWKGLMPFSQMPRVVNPKQGYIANWNNKPAVWWENTDTPVWGMIFRVYRLNDLIRSKPRLTVDDLKAFIRDIAEYDEDAGKLLPIMLRIVKRNERAMTDELRAAVRLLEAWDCHEREGSAAKVLWDAWLDAVRTRVFADDLGNFLSPDLFRLAIQPSYIAYALLGKRAPVPRLYDYFNGKEPEELLTIALADALTQLKRRYGGGMNLWRYSAPRMGWGEALPGVPYTDRGSYIQIIQFGEQFFGETVLPPGQSEDPNSPHYRDQRDLASWWFFKPISLNPPSAQ
ncbi:MAG: penicillin acylase family protein [Armatimonadota bacterium]|nr:penicillin acylase family protein [Armatimonadota bacterium]